MKKNIFMKGFVYVVVVLFIGTSSIPGISGEETARKTVSHANELLLQTSCNFFTYSKNSINNGTYRDSQPYHYFAPGELLIKFREDATIHLNVVNGILTTGIASVDMLNRKYCMTSAEQIFQHSLVPCLSTWYKCFFTSTENIFCLVDEYSHDPSVVFAEPNYIYQAATIGQDTPKTLPASLGIVPNDPLFGQQWALNKIDAPDAWTIEKGSPNVTIAIIDTGVDYLHPDLAGNMWTNAYGKHGYDFVNNDDDPMDDGGHGTLCAGTAAAVTNNSLGIAGVCWQCKIMALKGLDSNGVGYLDALVKSIVYATDNGANVISMSWGGSPSDVLKSALDYAYGHGVALIAIAGNSNTDEMYYPACYDDVIAVAATDQNDEKADFSNYGEWVDVAVPGVDIVSTTPGGNYGSASGTSLACPQVAGVAALVLSKNSQCPYPAQMVKSIIPFTTDDINSSLYIGTGRINAYKALLQEPFAAVLEPAPNWEDVKGTVDIKGAAWGEDFRYFTMEYGVDNHPTIWVEMMNSSTPQGGVLVSWDTLRVDEGLYTVRLTVVTDHGTYSDATHIYVNNRADGNYTADIYVSNCFDHSTPGWGITRFAGIQVGINHSHSGDTVFVYDGVYPEDVHWSVKSLQLIGQSRNWTIIDGTVMMNFTRGDTVSGFTVRGYKAFLNGIFSLLIWFSTKCTISDNIIPYAPQIGVSLAVFFSSDCKIEGNWIRWMTCTPPAAPRGACIAAQVNSHLNISGNTLLNAGAGMQLIIGHSNIIYNNTINFNFVGIDLLMKKSLIYKNIIAHGFGIHLWTLSSHNKFIANSLSCSEGGVEADSTLFNHFYYNNFMATSQALDDAIDIWYKPEGLFRGKGNYWWDYKGTDANGDGIGDTPYNITTGYLKDRYPLMKPVDITNVTGIGDVFREYTSYGNDNWATYNMPLLDFWERSFLLIGNH